MESAITTMLTNGMTIEVRHDPDCERPYDGDEGVRIVVLHRRYSDPAGGACGGDPEAVEEWAEENAGEWFVVPLWLYDHGGVLYRAAWSNPFSCPWDSGRVGIVALKRGEWGDGEESYDVMLSYAQSVAEEYSQWANGECYGFIVTDAEGERVDSSWGYVGLECALAEARESAKYHASVRS